MSSFGGTVKLTGESEYRKALGEISSNMKLLNSEMKNVTSQYDKNDQSVENLSSQNDVLNKKIEEQEKKVGILKDAMEQSAKETGENSEKTKKWKTELNNAQADLNKMNRELKDNADALEEAERKEKELEQQNKQTDKGVKGFVKTLLECGAGSKSLGTVIKGSLSGKLGELKESFNENVGKVKDFGSGVGKIVGDMKSMGVVAGLSVAALSLFKDEMKETGEETEKTGEEEEETEEKTFSLGDAIKANLISDAIKGGLEGLANGIKAIGEGFGTLLNLGEETKETNIAMGKLNEAFKASGKSAGEAQKTVTDLYGILGDTDTAVEASSLLAKMSNSEGDLEANTRILTGVFAQFGDSIPTTGLAEGMQATAKMGSVQGVLADALEWSGVNLDDYNAKLSKMKTEAERSAYIQQTLTDIYGESADSYRENNIALIESNEAALNYEKTLARMGTTSMIVNTDLTNIKSSLMSAFIPSITTAMESVGGVTSAFNDLIAAVVSGDKGGIERAMASVSESIEMLVEDISVLLPEAVSIAQNLISTFIQVIVDNAPLILNEGVNLLGSLLGGITSSLEQIFPVVVAVIKTLVETIVQNLPMIINMGIKMLTSLIEGIAKMLPSLIPMAVDCVVTIAETLLDNIDLVIDAAINIIMALAEGLVEALPDLVDKIPVIIDKLITAITNNLPKILEAGITIVLKIGEGLVKAVPQLIEKVPGIIVSLCNGFKSAWGTVKTIGVDLIKGIWNGIDDATEWILKQIKSFGSAVLNGLKDFFGIHSPSTVFKDEIGTNLALGVGEGFADTMADVSADMQGAIPTEFDADISTNMNMANGSAQMSTYDMMVSAFEQALTKVKVVMDDREMGGFVTDVVERTVYA